jgi:hypothetical protein
MRQTCTGTRQISTAWRLSGQPTAAEKPIVVKVFWLAARARFFQKSAALLSFRRVLLSSQPKVREFCSAP